MPIIPLLDNLFYREQYSSFECVTYIYELFHMQECQFVLFSCLETKKEDKNITLYVKVGTINLADIKLPLHGSEMH